MMLRSAEIPTQFPFWCGLVCLWAACFQVEEASDHVLAYTVEEVVRVRYLMPEPSFFACSLL